MTMSIDLLAVPDFIAGFIYGFTSENHMRELEMCYNGGTDLLDDVQIALTDIKDGAFLHGLEDIGHVLNHVPDTIANCKNIDDDLAGIEAWASIFKEPVKLAEEAGKNWLVHQRKIKADIA